MSEMRNAAVSIIREHIEDLETHQIDELIFRAFPRITPVDMAAAWGAYVAVHFGIRQTKQQVPLAADRGRSRVTDPAQGGAGFSLGPLTGELRLGSVSCRPEREDLKMSAKGIVIPADGGRRLDGLTPGGRFDLKLVGRDTADSIMLFEEICPVGRKSLYHLHRDSDEVIWVVAGEFSFKIGDEVTTGGPGTCAFMPRGVAHAWKNIGNDTGRLVALYTPAAAGGYIEELLEEGRPQTPEESKALADRHHWEIVGPNPL